MIINGKWHVVEHCQPLSRLWTIRFVIFPQYLTFNLHCILLVVLGPPCARKVRKEDPLDIFVFDLTSSSEEESCDDRNKVAKQLLKRYGTRSKKFQQISTKTFAESSKITTQQTKSKKSVTVTEDTSDLHRKVIPASNFKETSETDEETCSYRKTAANTPNRPIRPSLENGIPRSKVAQNVFSTSLPTIQVSICRAWVALQYFLERRFSVEPFSCYTSLSLVKISMLNHC